MTGPGPAAQHANHAQAVGTLADEAALLLDAVADRLARLRTSIPADGRWNGAPETAATADPGEHTRCVSWCPICRSAELLQGDRPELAGKLVDAALLVVTTVRSLIPPTEAATAPGGAPGTAPGGAPGTAPGGAPGAGRPGLERIDIR